MANRGVVAAGDPQTARAGAQILRAGGNAVDAVCASAFASFVCEPLLTSAAGAGVLMHGARDRPWSILDFFARVPGLGARPAELDFTKVQIDFGATTQSFHVGRGAAAVPGALCGLLTAAQQHGRLPLAETLAPATELARNGYVVSPCLAYTAELLEPIITLTPSTFALLSVDGRLARASDVLTNPGQVHLLESLARDPHQTMRAVEADLLQSFAPTQGGLLSAEDLARWQPTERRPLSVAFAQHEVLLNPPPSSGGGLVALGLRLAERRNLTDLGFGHHWTALAEILRAVSAARDHTFHARLSTQDFLPSLLSDAGVDAAWDARAAPEPALGSTTHISVLDDDGGAASLTASNGEGCGHTLEGWGIHVNNFLGEEDINPAGFHAEPPGSAMTTMMCPSVVLRGDRPVVALGSGGSNRIRSALLQGLLNVFGFERSLEAAVADDRLHVEGERLWFEATSMPTSVVRDLFRAWPQATRFEAQNMFFGGIHAAAWVDGRYAGAGDPRRGGAVCAAEDA